jgi:ATP-binding cassette subfamily B (MDR/TAP) protein 9
LSAGCHWLVAFAVVLCLLVLAGVEVNKTGLLRRVAPRQRFTLSLGSAHSARLWSEMGENQEEDQEALALREPLLALQAEAGADHEERHHFGGRVLAFLGGSAMTDLCANIVCGTAGFSSGLTGIPFGVTGLDFIIMSALRSVFSFAGAICFAGGDSSATSQTNSACDAEKGTFTVRRRCMHRSGAGNFFWWLPAVATPLLLGAKCLTRLIQDSSPDQPSSLSKGLGLGWYFGAISASCLGCLLQWSFLGRYKRAKEERRKKAEQQHQGKDLEEGTSAGGKENDEDTYQASLADLAQLVGADWVLVVCAFMALLIAAVGQVLIPHFTGAAVDAIVQRGGRASREEAQAIMHLVYTAIVCGIFTGLRGGIFTLIGARVNVRLRMMLFASLMRQEVGFYDITSTGDITSRLSSDATKVGDQVCLNVNFFLRNMVTCCGTLGFMCYLSWRLTAVACITVPLYVTASKVYGSYIRKLAKQTQDKLADSNSVAEEAISSLVTVRCFAAEDRATRNYESHLSEYYKLNQKEAIAYSAYAATSTLLPQLVMGLVLFYGGRLVALGEATGGQVVTFLLYLTTLSDCFANMATIFSSMTQAVGAADMVFSLIRRSPRMTTGSCAPSTCKGHIKLEGVEFTYPARPNRQVLHGVSFEIQPGQVLALVGSSGGGKSSIISLLENLYEPSKGRILLDGIPVQDYDRRWLARNVSIVNQEPTLFVGTIKDNIVFGLEEEPTMEEIRQAATLANAHQFIEGLPSGYLTQCGERGVQLSGGQKQRIAIARALVRKPKCLILDEATSALDSESESLVQDAMDALMESHSMTICVITHRLSTCQKMADVIAVVKEGRVAEMGSHEQLMALGGIYKSLTDTQQGIADGLEHQSTSAAGAGAGVRRRRRQPAAAAEQETNS